MEANVSTRERVIEVIAEVLEMPAGEVRGDARFTDDLGASSLDIVNLIWRVEEVFALAETPEERLEGVRTVNDVVGLVKEAANEEMSEVVETVDILIASDHAGVALKHAIVERLQHAGKTVADLGPNDTISVDYPDFAQRLTTRLTQGDAPLGILICGTGIGMSMAANRVPGVRAALVSEPVSARLTRRHNNANVLCLGARVIGVEVAHACVDAFLGTAFDPGDDGRHRRRIQLFDDLA
jgi:ribose 5-phosphate isomerase B